jgi:hypothetical protein
MIRLLFQEARATVSLNGEIIDSFEIGCGVRQGYPLAPYLFLIIAIALYSATKVVITANNLVGITLPDGETQ